MDGRNILILGGTGDAIFIAEQLSLAPNLKYNNQLSRCNAEPSFSHWKNSHWRIWGKGRINRFLGKSRN